MDARLAQYSERGQHQDADPGSEVAAIDGHQELKEDGSGQAVARLLDGVGLDFQPPRNGVAEGKQGGGKEDQLKDNSSEMPLAGLEQQDPAQQPSQQTHRRKAPHPGSLRAQFTPVRPERANQPRHQRQRIRSVTVDRGRTEKHQRRKTDKRTGPSDGVDDTSDGTGEEKMRAFEKKGHSLESHGADSRGRVAVQSPSILSEPSGVRKGFPST